MKVTSTGARKIVILGRLAFCGYACVDAALTDWRKSDTTERYVPATFAPLISCYGCGFHMDEIEGDQP